MSPHEPHLVLLGQIPPPWHGQAVATQILFEHDWPGFDAECLRMDYSDEMDEVGRFQLKKVGRLVKLIKNTRRSLARGDDSILFYPPASAKWIPFLRDVIFLACVRGKAARTVFIYHASGLAEFAKAGPIRGWLADVAYGGADMALEVAEERIAPHREFAAKDHLWCPCGIDVPKGDGGRSGHDGPLRVLFMGSLQEGKGVLEILKTAAILKERGHGNAFRFEVVGRWMDEQFASKALSMHKKLGLAEMVRFPGQLIDGEKWNAYHHADLFFFPSHYPSEASPIVLMEALGAGLPVITTEWNGIPALMAGCSTATLLPIKSPERYADALVGFHQSRESLHACAADSRTFYEKNFTPASFVGRVSTALHRVADSRGRAKIALSAGAGNDDPAPRAADALQLSVYLADQNPGYDRSLGISRMSEVVLDSLAARDDVSLHVVSSRTSRQGPASAARLQVLPWGTRSKFMRVVTDHFHPLLSGPACATDVWYFPKGFLPKMRLRVPTVVTIHDTIIQHYWDNHPGWRKRSEYAYWAEILKSSLLNADGILTVSENSKEQILAFMERHKIRKREILVTYEPCVYELIEQPVNPAKGGYVLHLCSKEPHKMTGPLVRWWTSNAKGKLPPLHLVGSVSNEIAAFIEGKPEIVKHPYLSDDELQERMTGADALVLPSEIEGFGLPAIEAYYLGTPVCYNLGTSIEEILRDSTRTGGFQLDDLDSLGPALEATLAMSADEVRRIGLELRQRYASHKVVDRMMEGFRGVAGIGN